MLGWPATRRGCGGLIVAAALLVFAGPARAECGEYVHIRGKSQATKPTPPADTPCSRGQCDRPTTPAPTPVASATSAPVDAVLTPTLVLPSAEVTPTAGLNPAARPEPVPSSLLDPPRG